jgi:hypothetical protein
MSKFIIILISFVILCSISCSRDEDNDPDSGISGTFSAKLDGVDWIASADKVTYVVQDYGSGPKIFVVALRNSDTSQFNILVPYFYGSDTTINFPSSNIIRLQIRSVLWQCNSGTLSINKSVSGGIEILNGYFSGTLKDPVFASTPIINLTAGTFTSRRLL